MAMSFALSPLYVPPDAKKASLAPSVILSLAFHLIAFVGIPVLAMLFYHPNEFKRPATFQLVSAQAPRAQAAPVTPAPQEAAPAPKETAPKPVAQKAVKPVPKTSKAKPALQQKKQVTKPAESEKSTENNDDLNELLSAIPVKSVSEVAVTSQFKFNWYLQLITSRVENNWKPPRGLTNKKDAVVVVVFSILQNGTIANARVAQSSGVGALDTYALQSINASAPFPALPIGFNEKKLEVSYKLHYDKS
jgi:periplasmic protein TonB